MVLRITVRPLGVEAPPPTDQGLGLPGGLDNPELGLPDEPQLESAFVIQAAARRKQKALDTIEELAPTPPQQAAAGDGSANVDQQISEPAAAAAARETAAGRTAIGVASPARTPLDRVVPSGSVGRDLARGTTEAPRQILGGVRDAVQSTVDLTEWLTGEGAKALGAVSSAVGADVPADLGKKIDAQSKLHLPDVKAATTVTGGVVRSVSQFLTGFAAAGGAIGGTATVTRAAVAGGLADFTAFDVHEKRLSNLIQEIPALANPVNEFLAAKPEDGEIEGRLKRAIEGLGLGAAAEGLFRAVRYVRDARRAAAADPEAAAARAAAAGPPAPPPVSLGDESAPLVAKKADVKVDVAEGGGKTRPASPQEEMGVPDAVVARALTEKGLTPLTEGPDAVFINFGRMKTTEDVIQALTDTAAAFKGNIEAARRGVRSNKVTQMASGKEDAWKVLSERRRGDPLNAEQSVAARRLWEASGEKLVQVAETATAAPTAENLFAFRQMMAIHSEIQAQVIAARTETARSLQSWQIPVGGTGKNRLASIENLLITYGGPEASSLLARKVAALKNLDEGMQVLDDVVSKGAFAKSMDVVKEVWVNALLSNPKTHIVNMLGNTIGLGQELIERMAASVFSRAIGSGEIMPGEAAAKLFALNQGTREGIRMFGQALKTGESQFGAQTTKTAEQGFERAIASEHLGLNPDNWFGRAVDGLGTMVNTPVRFLTAEDDFFKAIGYRTEVAAQAFRQASKEVSAGQIEASAMKTRVAELMADPPEHIHMAAVDYARYMTYTQDPGTFVAAINRLDRSWAASDQVGGQLASLSMRMLIPFRNTPGHLITYAFERTPMAPLFAKYREAINQGGAAADIARTRMALGTMTLLAMMDLALDGHLTGAGPKDDKDRGTRDTLIRSGWQPYSVKVGDRYFSYRRTDPLGISLGIAGDIAELVNNAALDEDKQDQIFKLTAAAAASFGNQVLDKTYMASVADLFDVLHKPDKAGTFVEKRIASFEPSIANEARRQLDPYMRYTGNLIAEIRNRTPGLSESLPLARDVWGRPKTYQSGMGTLYDALSPIASRKFDPQPVDNEAIKNDFNIAPPVPMLTFGVGLSVSLRNKPEAYSRYLELRGQTKPSELGVDMTETVKAGARKGQPKWKWGDQPLLDMVNDLVSGKHPMSDAYAAASEGRNGGKDTMVARAIADYGRVAKYRVVKEFPEVKAALERKGDAGASAWSDLANDPTD